MTVRAVAIVDDDESMRDSLAILLDQHGYPNSQFPSANDLLNWVTPQTDVVIITDVRMPGMDGLQLVEALKVKGCRQPVIVITGHGDIPLAVRAMKAGVADFFEKPFDGAALVASVQRANSILDSDSSVQSNRAAVTECIDSLSPRERQVLDELVEGKSNKMIAASLAISPRTVEIYRANVMTKMRASSLSELVRMTIVAQAA